MSSSVEQTYITGGGQTFARTKQRMRGDLQYQDVTGLRDKDDELVKGRRRLWA